MCESAGVSPCAYLLLTLLMYEKLEMLQSMIAHEDLSSWFTNQELLLTPAHTPLSLTHSHEDLSRRFTNQELLLTPAYTPLSLTHSHEDLSRWFTNQELLLTPAHTPLSLTHSNQSVAETATFKRGCITAHLCM